MEDMKKILSIIAFLTFSISLYSQTYHVGLDANVVSNYKDFKKGTKVHIESMTHYINYFEGGLSSKPIINNIYKINTDKGDVIVKEKLGKVFDVNYKNAQNYWDSQIIFNVLEELSDNGTQEEIRAEMEEDALEYISRVKSSGLEFKDPFLESYIYGVISRLSPMCLIDGRPGVVNLLILSGTTANAWMFPNGTLCITTGLISLLHSEDELAAILAHEIAHFVLDHSVQNYNKAVSRQERAAFWAGLATVLTGVAEGVAAANNPYYQPGLATLSVAIASEQIAVSLCKRLGMLYTRSQEEEADEKAKELMAIMGYNPNSLATALSRIETVLKEERSISMYFASDHPALIERIKNAGTPSTDVDKNFEKIISFAVSDAAYWKMQNRRYRQALPLYSQNITNSVASADDYIQKANCLLYMKNDPESMTEVMGCIQQAKSINDQNINVYKTEIIAYFRQQKYGEAKNLLSAYKTRLSSWGESLKNNTPETNWTYAFSFITDEISWVNNMIQKLKNF